MSFIKKTFGGLSASYYLRHLFFGAIFTTLYVILFIVWEINEFLHILSLQETPFYIHILALFMKVS
ncbi:hypothetical protein [Campylobacter showae]|uniref:hypothetical protein n=1 Tax=Campylobacter showae TaxID=204 RepID=UPI001FCB0B33|nr:hypothetical protein [Campylobacter showae]